jgi:hypothetical protein
MALGPLWAPHRDLIQHHIVHMEKLSPKEGTSLSQDHTTAPAPCSQARVLSSCNLLHSFHVVVITKYLWLKATELYSVPLLEASSLKSSVNRDPVLPGILGGICFLLPPTPGGSRSSWTCGGSTYLPSQDLLLSSVSLTKILLIGFRAHLAYPGWSHLKILKIHRHFF